MIIFILVILAFFISLAFGLFLNTFSLYSISKINNVHGVSLKKSLKIEAKLFLVVLPLILLISFIIISFFALVGNPSTVAPYSMILVYVISLVVLFYFFNAFMKRCYATSLWKNSGIFILSFVLAGFFNVLIAAPAVIWVRSFVFQPFIIQGSSMSPNYNDGKYLFIEEWDRNYHRGDVVIFKYPIDPSKRFIKRIIGLPGETIQAKDNRVYITKNGVTTELNESGYLPAVNKSPGFGPTNVPSGQYFVLGDNRGFSSDSKDYGPVPANLIIGRVLDN
jgi:signal peptidase I